MSIPPIEKFVGSIPVHPANLSEQDTQQYVAALFDSAAAAGLSSLRIAFFWNYLGPNVYGYNQRHIELVTSEARRKGFKIYGIINPPNNPSAIGWTPPNPNPDVRATLLLFITNMAFAYGGEIECWEIFNESNQEQRDEHGNLLAPYYEGTSFAPLLRDSYFALLNGFQQRDDYSSLVSQRGGAAFKMYPAGTAGTDIDWIDAVCAGLENLYNAHPGESKYINGFSIHPFSAPKGPDEHLDLRLGVPPFTIISRGSLRANIDWTTFTLGKHPRVPNELFIGEYGWSTLYEANPPQAVSEDLQGRFVAEGFLEAHASGSISQAIWAWTFRDVNNLWPFWDHTGAMRVDGSQKPSYRAIKNLVDQLRGKSLQQDLSWMLSDGRMFLYRAGNTTKLVYWCTVDTKLTIQVSTGATLKLVDHQGRFIRDWPAGTLTINPFAVIAPRFLEVNGGAITSIQGIPLSASGVPELPGWTRVPVSSANASSTLAGSSPSFAFDNNAATYWNAGQFPEAWVEATFNGPQTVGGVILNVAQLPAGNTKHQILFRINNGSYQQVHTFSGHTASNMKLVAKFATPYQRVTHIRVLTTVSPSWVAWLNIAAYRQ
jgi:hypothetical protein